MSDNGFTLGDLAGLEKTMSKIAPDWRDEPPFIHESAQGNNRAKHIADILAKVKYTRRKIRWIIYNSKPFVSEPYYTVTASTTVADAEGGGLIDVQMISHEVAPDFDDALIVRMAFRILEHFEQHEAREHFYFDGDKVYDPHDEHKFFRKYPIRS